MTDPVALELELPMPPPELSPNARKHWAAKAKVVAAYRYEAREIARSARWNWAHTHGSLWEPLKEPVHATVTFVLKTKRARDMDNLFASLKPGFDGLRDAGVLRDDTVWTLHFTLLAEHEPESRRGTAVPAKRAARVKIKLEAAP